MVRRVEEHVRQLEYFRVLLTLCNRLCTPLFFNGKLMALTCSIRGTFYVIKHLGSGSVILLLFLGSLSPEALAFYIVSIQKPATIPIICDDIKRKCLHLLCHQRRGRTEELSSTVKLSVLKLRTMPELVVRETGYHGISSLSSIVFIDFYINQVISLVITF